MGTILVNPFELNFGLLAARNAENVVFEASNTQTTLLPNETITTACNSMYPTTNVEIYQEIRDHPNPYNNSNITVTCQGYNYPDNPGTSGANRKCGTRYFVEFQSSKVKGTGSPLHLSAADFSGDIFTSGYQQYYASLTDARMVRDAIKDHWNVFRSEPGCDNSQALNYSPVSSANPCPCESSTPVWTQGQDQSNNPQLQQITERAGDCSCLMPPSNLDGHGYLVEKWEYIGTPYPPEYEAHPSTAQLVKQWRWKRDTGKSSLPQSNEDDTLYAIAKEGWRATGLNPPQEFIVKPNLTPPSWKKYRLITATGFEKMGCMDNTAMNYDPEAQVQPAIPTATDWSEEYEAAAQRATKYKCQYCTDNDLNATIYNQDTGKCECKAGYSLKGGKCKKASATDKGKDEDEDEDEDKGMTMTIALIGIVGITAVGLLTTMFAGGEKLE